jgi:hypothetical protein
MKLPTVTIESKEGPVVINVSDFDVDVHKVVDPEIEAKRMEVASLKEKSKLCANVAKKSGATVMQKERADLAKKKATEAAKELKAMEKG